MHASRPIIREVVRDLYVLRIDDHETKFFEGLWEIPEGISYNAYLLKTGEGAVLFDGWKKTYADLLVEEIEKLVDLRDIKYVVVHHMEPDHSGSIPAVMTRVTNAVLLGHPLAGKMISNFYGAYKFKPVSDGEELKIGEHSLRFIHAPWLHWPETIFTHIVNLNVLLTCDAFGSYSLPPVFDSEVEDWNQLDVAIRKYYVNVIGKYSQNVLNAVEKLKSLQVSPSIIAPSHGAIFREKPAHILDKYIEIARGVPKENKAVVAYVSMYGFIEQMIDATVSLLREKGFNVKIYRFTDNHRDNVSDLLGDLSDAGLMVIGGGTYEAGVQPLLGYILHLIASKLGYRAGNLPVLVLTSYGWGPVAGKMVLEELKNKGFTRIENVEATGQVRREYVEKIRQAIEKLTS
ncbi:MAG: MBL fold metallo-hydrolase [Thermofilum sp.]|jgi:flavorubredoxin|nr:MBL fold metallo-hydrolase [Thermofilum sp.]